MREFTRAVRRELVWWLGGFARLLRRHPAGLLSLAGVGLLSWAIGIDFTGFWLVIGGLLGRLRGAGSGRRRSPGS